jgi:hypothetical protein
LLSDPARCLLMTLAIALHSLLASATIPLPAPQLWFYEVSIPRDLRVLSIEARFPEGTSEELSVESGTERFVRKVTLVGGHPQDVALRGTSWFAPRCAKGCRIRYEFALAEAAASLANSDLAAKYGDVFESPPGAWLLRPLRAQSGARMRLHVSAPAGQFATGLLRAAGAPDVYEAAASDLPRAPYSAFGSLRIESFTLDRAELEVAAVAADRRLAPQEISAWIHTSARMIQSYFTRFPIPRATVLVLPGRGDRIHGRTLGGGGATILLWLGPDVTEEKLRGDWVLVHELAHLGFPTVMRRHHWAEEGLATYVEPIARARAGALSSDEVWAGLIHGLPKGLPREGDRGLDRTPTWGRIYWGGALFWFLADVRIRQRTANRKSIDDALRAIVADGGNIGAAWDFDRVLDVADQATGTPVLKQLYADMSTHPTDVDLDSLFRQLGVATQGDQLVFNGLAPLAKIRESITLPRTSE